jgi:acyl-[acyl-carrier-protein]-phospholipid O-acyltransferase/long-chain-fatty-acid--[acyl-carrier-protein] ligase
MPSAPSQSSPEARIGGKPSWIQRFLRLPGVGFFSGLHSWLAEVEVLGAVPKGNAGGVIWMTGSLSSHGALALRRSLGVPIRFLGWRGAIPDGWGPWVLGMEVLPADTALLKREVVRTIQEGGWVCFWANGDFSGALRGWFEAGENRGAGALWPVDVEEAPQARGGGWGRRPRVTIAFGERLEWATTSWEVLQEAGLAVREMVFQARPELRGHLGRAALFGLQRNLRALAVVDGMDGSQLRCGELLAAALAFSQWIRREVRSKRVGIVLPPGRGATIANLAVVLAGKVPVNLNFTAGRESIEAACRIAGLEWALTAKGFAGRLAEFPWPGRVVFLEELLPGLRGGMRLWGVLAATLPSGWVAALLGLPKMGDREEAIVLFTSGSSGEPKGVVLSHRNVLGNVRQFSGMLRFERGLGVLACLPVFHSFGSTVTLWYPILEGMRMVTYPSPMDPAKNAELIEAHQVALLCSTPTFLRGYLRKVEPQRLRSLRMVVTGAERLPMELADAFRERFGMEVFQGYGLTETAPVASVNLPNAPGVSEGDPVRSTQRRGSVGKLAPGMAACIRCPESDQPRSLHETGMLWLRGPNIFEGYLSDPVRSAEVLRENWFRTGDLARFDADGFLYIEGRVSRFSKIAGEMVPHETVETHLHRALDIPAEERVLVVTGIPEESRGEALVVLSTRPLNLAELRVTLQAQGLPNLWLPKRWMEVSQIPVLATGKLDLRAIRELALQQGTHAGI